MAKEKCPIQFRNPCKNCLVRSACKGKCLLLQSHIELFEILYCLVVISTSITVLSVIFAIFYSYTSAETTLSIFALYITVSYMLLLLFYIDQQEEFNLNSKYQKIFIIVTLIVLIVAYVVIYITEPIMLKRKQSIFRYCSSYNSKQRINKC